MSLSAAVKTLIEARDSANRFLSKAHWNQVASMTTKENPDKETPTEVRMCLNHQSERISSTHHQQ